MVIFNSFTINDDENEKIQYLGDIAHRTLPLFLRCIILILGYFGVFPPFLASLEFFFVKSFFEAFSSSFTLFRVVQSVVCARELLFSFLPLFFFLFLPLKQTWGDEGCPIAFCLSSILFLLSFCFLDFDMEATKLERKGWQVTFGKMANAMFGQITPFRFVNFDPILDAFRSYWSIFLKHDITIFSRALSTRHLLFIVSMMFEVVDIRVIYFFRGYELQLV